MLTAVTTKLRNLTTAAEDLQTLATQVDAQAVNDAAYAIRRTADQARGTLYAVEENAALVSWAVVSLCLIAGAVLLRKVLK